jgi:hypothetical protein
MIDIENKAFHLYPSRRLNATENTDKKGVPKQPQKQA